MSEKRKRGIPLKANALALIDQKMNETGYENRDDLAEAAGLNTKTVDRIFQGHQPQRDTVKALAKALGILPTDLANQRDLYPTVSNSVQQKKNLGELDQNVCLAMLEPKRELASPVGKKDDGKDYWSVDPVVKSILLRHTGKDAALS